ncbi:hypothetical protein [Arcticibacterium luteifluviistationis]|uniref:Uncharacterized protein n=1 Tax=Arcticibacterium luteifluviistationis TaxID=1784714 RepID=A0A2Z4G980_9BACT|nr:hypothetical protein [Arcticibacterium luteifluviistationis]AWV97704.1 hypothetical protein DJ013_05795 [Arcticibacterium luteifluviistationis]
MKSHKLTIFPFLNTKVSKAADGNRFPLYYRITYMRKNTMLRSFEGGVYADLEGPEIKEVIETETEDIRALMGMLTELFTMPYDMTGIKARYEMAQMHILEVIDQNIRDVVSRNLKTIDNEFAQVVNVGVYSEDYPLHVLMNAIEKLMPEDSGNAFEGTDDFLDYLIDWIDVYPMGGAQPRIVDWLNLNHIDKRFMKYLSGRYDSEEKVKEIMEGIFNLIITKINMPM